jgi:hypothetical protein
LGGEYLSEDLEDTTSSFCWRIREGEEGEEQPPPPPWMREGEVGREK